MIAFVIFSPIFLSPIGPERNRNIDDHKDDSNHAEDQEKLAKSHLASLLRFSARHLSIVRFRRQYDGPNFTNPRRSSHKAQPSRRP